MALTGRLGLAALAGAFVVMVLVGAFHADPILVLLAVNGVLLLGVLVDLALAGAVRPLVLSREGHLDALEVVGELREPLALDVLDALERELKHRIKTNVGVTTKVRLVAPNGIERTLTGKARRVVDQRPRERA